MTVIKRDRQSSAKDLIAATEKFCVMLDEQDEEEAASALRNAAKVLTSATAGSSEYRGAVNAVIDAFEGDHELNAYIISKPNPNEWTTADELSQAATRVLSLARRLRA